MPHIEPLDPGFSTADAEYPELRLAQGVLSLRFIDWREQEAQVQFNEVCGFRWQEAASLLPGEAYDGACELVDSDWVKLHVDQEALPRGTNLRHLRFNFNAWGQLEVLCVSHSVIRA